MSEGVFFGEHELQVELPQIQRMLEHMRQPGRRIREGTDVCQPPSADHPGRERLVVIHGHAVARMDFVERCT
jgi:hypothetical protein